MLEDCAKLLDDKSAAIVLTVYAIRASTLAFAQLTEEVIGTRRGAFEVGELVIREQASNRVVPTSLYTRWTSP